MGRARRNGNTKQRKGGRGHPSRVTRQERRRRFWQPDETEGTIQALNRMMRREIQDAYEGDGIVTGPLVVAAKHLAPQLAGVVAAVQQPTAARAVLAYIDALDRAGDPAADPHMHIQGIERWLVGMWGEVVHAFDPVAYLDHREQSRRRARVSRGDS